MMTVLVLVDVSPFSSACAGRVAAEPRSGFAILSSCADRRLTLNQLSVSNPSRGQATPCVPAFPGAGQFDHSLTFGSEAQEFFERVHWCSALREQPKTHDLN
jgi:hypothetical protein